MHKRPIHQQVRQVWRDDSRHESPVPIASLLKALGRVVYAVRTRDGLVKIGCTCDLARRAQQVGMGMKSILGWRQGTFADEAAIHARLDGLAARGKEFYPWCDEVERVVNEMRASLGIAPVEWVDAA